uniref:Uncharacterized protein n=1 Tax=Paramoeba aestuarina TaxID=180227 RepID=A0A7S4P6N0_9EUKA|mmetsp:Transcript_37007/g.58214  ORF Transcript_37007/g.58214 Transcript_37007/m.58214 type:complete len:115 (+) Transcript_37007:320-664(+)
MKLVTVEEFCVGCFDRLEGGEEVEVAVLCLPCGHLAICDECDYENMAAGLGRFFSRQLLENKIAEGQILSDAFLAEVLNKEQFMCCLRCTKSIKRKRVVALARLGPLSSEEIKH